ncbi:MAG: DUF4249 domain-containing protein [Bacteroidales bacterium]|nr:DUF4249 domain-containing protein [Bacteroidales bacterium]
MKNTIINILLIITLLSFYACDDNDYIFTEEDFPIVEAYLIPGKPINHVKLSKLIPFLSKDTLSYAEPISNLNIRILLGNNTYELVEKIDSAGWYYFPDTKMLVAENQEYSIELTYNEKRVSARTFTPEKPVNFELSQNLFYIERMEEGDMPTFDVQTCEVTWDNPDGSYYYLNIELMDTVIDPVNYMITDTITQTLTSPVISDVYNITSRNMRYYGTYRVILYKVNEEYAYLYSTTSTTSQSLTDPYTNVENGKGIFTAFNTDTLFFEVKEY